MEFEYYLASGLAMLIIGIFFIWNRINFIKKGNIAIATVVKLEMSLDDENDPHYVASFTFTTYDNKEVRYEHSNNHSGDTWHLRQRVKLAYKEKSFDDHEVLLLTYLNVFGMAVVFLSIGIVLLIIAGSFYWNISGYTPFYFIPGSVVIFIAAFKIWANYFFKTLQ